MAVEPLEFSTEMWNSMSILEFMEKFYNYRETVLRFDNGNVRNSSRLFDVKNFDLPKDLALAILVSLHIRWYI